MSALAVAAIAQPHIKVFGGGLSFERCEDAGCVVGSDGRASCGRPACPSCGCGGANVIVAGDGILCSCGHGWSADSSLS